MFQVKWLRYPKGNIGNQPCTNLLLSHDLGLPLHWQVWCNWDLVPSPKTAHPAMHLRHDKRCNCWTQDFIVPLNECLPVAKDPGPKIRTLYTD